MFDDLLPDLTGLPTDAVLVTVFVLSFLETSVVVGVFLPGEVLVAACIGVLPAALSPLAGVAAATGCLIGQVVGYLVGRALGPTLYHSWLGRRTGPHRLAKAEQLARDAGGWVLITARFVAVAHTLAPVLAGVLRMPARRFGASAALSSTIWAVVWTALGVVVGQTGRLMDPGLMTTVLVIAGTVTATLVAGRVLRVSRRSRSATGMAAPIEPIAQAATDTTVDATVAPAAESDAAGGGARNPVARLVLPGPLDQPCRS